MGDADRRQCFFYSPRKKAKRFAKHILFDGFIQGIPTLQPAPDCTVKTFQNFQPGLVEIQRIIRTNIHATEYNSRRFSLLQCFSTVTNRFTHHPKCTPDQTGIIIVRYPLVSRHIEIHGTQPIHAVEENSISYLYSIRKRLQLEATRTQIAYIHRIYGFFRQFFINGC